MNLLSLRRLVAKGLSNVIAVLLLGANLAVGSDVSTSKGLTSVGSTSAGSTGTPPSFQLILDADMSSGAKVAGRSIEQGIRVALSEVNNQVQGVNLELVIKDHRGSTPRSLSHLNEFLNNESALVVFGGLHSPPLLANKDFINANQILTLVPWAAAGPITRSSTNENWIYRLSIDDSRAGSFIVDRSIVKEKFKKPYLLLEQTGWGRSNLKTMSQQLEHLDIAMAGQHMFNWNIGIHEAKVIARNIANSGADVVFLVANAPEGKVLLEALMDDEGTRSIAVRSHWGITGGDFYQSLKASTRDTMDLKFIQTDFSFVSSDLSDQAQQVFARAQTLFPQDLSNVDDIQAPTGFVHGYDLTRLLLETMGKVDMARSVVQIRKDIKDQLESLDTQVRGLIRDYKRPFSEYTANNLNAHEAIDPENYAMGYFDSHGVIHIER